ncbi:MAG: class I SAM-dependent methyltransferase [bacterium]
MDLLEIENTKNNRHPWELARANFVISLIRQELTKMSLKKVRILDIGCGDMFIADCLADSFENVEIIAVDSNLSKDDIEKFKQINSKKIKVFRTINDFQTENEPLPVRRSRSARPSLRCDNKMDFVLILDVFEHINDEQAFLQQLIDKNIFDNTAVFLITVPSFQSLYCSHDAYLRHFRRYRNSRLVKFFLNNNFIIQDSGYFFITLLFPRLVRVILEKFGLLKKSNGIGQWSGNKMMTFIIKNILIVDCMLMAKLKKIRLKLPGLSNYVICRKPAS